jgi:hypothetical protein
MEHRILNLQALLLVQAADISSVLEVVQLFEAAVRPQYPDLPDLGQEFLKRRKATLHALLESYEDSNPGFAARLQQCIDASPKIYPFDYE